VSFKSPDAHGVAQVSGTTKSAGRAGRAEAVNDRDAVASVASRAVVEHFARREADLPEACDHVRRLAVAIVIAVHAVLRASVRAVVRRARSSGAPVLEQVDWFGELGGRLERRSSVGDQLVFAALCGGRRVRAPKPVDLPPQLLELTFLGRRSGANTQARLAQVTDRV
jgi:hypothetical protein